MARKEVTTMYWLAFPIHNWEINLLGILKKYFSRWKNKFNIEVYFDEINSETKVNCGTILTLGAKLKKKTQ